MNQVVYRCGFVTVMGIVLTLGNLSTARATRIFLEEDGQVVAEAENYSEMIQDPTGTHRWIRVDGATGSFVNAREDYMRVLPDVGDINDNNVPFGEMLSTSPLLNYVVRISTPGEYRLYLRWTGDDPFSDSIYGSIVELRDGQGGAADWYRYEDQLQDGNFATGPWDGVGEFEGVSSAFNDVPAVWTISSPGDYTVQLIRREDGAAADTLVLQLASLPPPKGIGPPERPMIPEPSTVVLLGLGLVGVLLAGGGRRAGWSSNRDS